MKQNFLLAGLLLLGLSVFAAKPSVKFSGYVQGQFQHGEKDASLKVGTANENPEKSFNRIGIRRGRLKMTAEYKLFSGVFQIDLTENGVGLKDAYLNAKDPWIGTLQLRAGIFDRPFGNEISYSSSLRESPERSTVFQTLFPGERDLGAMLVLQAPKTSAWHILKLEAGLFAGNGINKETDSHKDFIGHLSVKKPFGENIVLGGGVSYYNGGVYQATDSIYHMRGSSFVLNTNPEHIGKFARREYAGIDLQFSASTQATGSTQVRAEYLFGRQPASAGSSKSPGASVLPTGNTYLRSFNGAYIILVQDLGKLPLSAVLKYDIYDPNSKVSGDKIGTNGTGKTDLAYQTFGFGLLWKASSAFRVQAFYEINKNERTANIADRQKDLKDNVFTLRLQYKF